MKVRIRGRKESWPSEHFQRKERQVIEWGCFMDVGFVDYDASKIDND